MMFRESANHKALTCANYKFNPVPLRYDLQAEIGSFPRTRIFGHFVDEAQHFDG